MTHYAVDGEAQLALDLALELAFKQVWLVQGLVRALEEGHGRPGHSLRGLPHLQNLLLKPPPHQSHFLTGCPFAFRERARFNPKWLVEGSARSVPGAMAKTRLMFVNEAEPSAALPGPHSPNLCTRPR